MSADSPGVTAAGFDHLEEAKLMQSFSAGGLAADSITDALLTKLHGFSHLNLLMLGGPSGKSEANVTAAAVLGSVREGCALHTRTGSCKRPDVSTYVHPCRH